MNGMARDAVPSDRPVLLDCGMGRKIARRGVENREEIWSAKALMVAPEVARQIHVDCIRAGADVIITDTYSVVRSYLALAGIEDCFEELTRAAREPAR
jgi:S-methylmethionine-dependent homocysteine/selenocysteine methylase